MVNYHTVLFPGENKLCTIVLPWVNHHYQKVHMGASNVPDNSQEKISELFKVLNMDGGRYVVRGVLRYASSSQSSHKSRPRTRPDIRPDSSLLYLSQNVPNGYNDSHPGSTRLLGRHRRAVVVIVVVVIVIVVVGGIDSSSDSFSKT